MKLYSLKGKSIPVENLYLLATQPTPAFILTSGKEDKLKQGGYRDINSIHSLDRGAHIDLDGNSDILLINNGKGGDRFIQAGVSSHHGEWPGAYYFYGEEGILPIPAKNLRTPIPNRPYYMDLNQMKAMNLFVKDPFYLFNSTPQHKKNLFINEALYILKAKGSHSKDRLFSLIRHILITMVHFGYRSRDTENLVRRDPSDITSKVVTSNFKPPHDIEWNLELVGLLLAARNNGKIREIQDFNTRAISTEEFTQIVQNGIYPKGYRTKKLITMFSKSKKV